MVQMVKRIHIVRMWCVGVAVWICSYASAWNEDVHLRQFVQCINDSNFVCAAEQMPQVESWEAVDAWLDLNHAFDFWSYIYEQDSTIALDSFVLYIAQEAREYYNDMKAQERLSDAVAYAEAERDIYAMMGDEYIPYYIQALNSIGNTYFYLGNYQESLQAFEQVLEVGTKFWGEDSKETGSFFINMGAIYHALDDYNAAEKYYLKSLEHSRKYFGKDNEDNIQTLNNLGVLYGDMLAYSKAEECYLEAIRINELHQLIYPDQYALSLHNIATLRADIGDYEGTEKIYLKALDIFKELYGEDNLSYASTLQLLGDLYQDIGKHMQAMDCYAKAIDIRKDKLGRNHPSTAVTLCRISNLCIKDRDYDAAERYCREAMEIDSIVFGTRHSAYARDLCNLGDIYVWIKEYTKAEKLFTQALDIRQTILGPNHPLLSSVLLSLCWVYEFTGRYDKEEELIRRYYAIEKKRFLHSLEFMSERQRLSFSELTVTEFNYLIPCFGFHYYPQDRTISRFIYDYELFRKGLLLNSSSAIQRSILESKNSTLIKQWEELAKLRRKIVAMEEKGDTTGIEQYTDEAERLEKEITRSSATYRKQMEQWEITWNSVKKVLKPGQVAIEFSVAPLEGDSTMYYALLLRDTCSYPIMIPLFKEIEVLPMLNTTTPYAIHQTYSAQGNGLRLTQKIWQNIQPYINEGEVLFFAPTGILHHISMENLPYDNRRTMADVYHFVRLSSTREIVSPKTAAAHKTATMFGDIRYGASPNDLAFAHANMNKQRSMVKDLPGTKQEVEEIEHLLKEKNIRVQVFHSMEANEERFKAISGQKQNIIHLATHGFYWSDSTARKEKFFRQRWNGEDSHHSPIDPLERCGLLFAGANTALAGHSERLEKDVQDGILTAKEISTLDLRGADIVVLSACETGLGDIWGDGVFGLQRAFKIAGAQTMLMALWKVDDDATRLLMTSFYRNMSMGMSKRQAFRLAQQEVRNYTSDGSSTGENRSALHEKYKQKGKGVGKSQPSEVSGQKSGVSHPYASPYYWAGFILLD